MLCVCLTLTSFSSADSQTLIINYIVPASDTPPTLDNVINHTHTVNTSFSYDIDATDDNGINAFSINDTSVFSINASTGLLTNNTPLINITTYWLNVSVDDTIGQIDWEEFFINVIASGISECNSYQRIGRSDLSSKPYGRLCYYHKFY